MHFLSLESPLKMRIFVSSCGKLRLWWDLRKQTLNITIKEKWRTLRMWAIIVLMRYIDTSVPRKLKSSWIDAAEPVQLAVEQVLSCTMSLHSMFLLSHPSIPLLLKAKCILHSSIRWPICIMSVYSGLGGRKQRYQSKATVLLLQTPPHFRGKAGIIAGVWVL